MNRPVTRREKQSVLFVCIHNGARSQMAEAFLNRICGDNFMAHSAGIESGKLNPIVVEAMREIGVDISGNQTKSVADIRVFKARRGKNWRKPAKCAPPSGKNPALVRGGLSGGGLMN